MTSGEPYVVVMPRLGLSMTQGTIVEWIKKDGEWVNKGEDLFTFESDKSAIVIEAPASGSLRILVEVGQPVDVQTPVAVIGGDSDSLLVPSEGDRHRVDEAHPLIDAALSRGKRTRVTASPRARALARERGLKLEGIQGTGTRGMVVVADLDRAHRDEVHATPVARRLAEETGVDLAGVQGTGPKRRITRTDVELALARPGSAIQPLTGLRAIIADRLTRGWRERPQVTLNTDADAVSLITIREQLSQDMAADIPFDALFVRIVAQALAEFPYMNVRLTSSGIELLKNFNIGVAVDTERGLLVPVIPNVNQLSLAETVERLYELSERARQGTSLPDDLAEGTFTITNLGMYGIDGFTPIINPPEAAILGIGRIAARPVAWAGEVVLRERVTLSLSFDHRLVDGAPAARFLARIRGLIEQPASVFVKGQG